MKVLEEQVLDEIRGRLEALIRQPVREVKRPSHNKSGATADLVLQVGPHLIVVEIKLSGEAARVAQAVKNVKSAIAELEKEAIPLVVVPFMGEVGQRVCMQEGVSWMDLSGNAEIAAKGLLIHVAGQPNKFKRQGRPSNIFSPKSSRVARQILLDPRAHYTQRDLARAVGLGEGFVSRIVRKLEGDRLLERYADGSIAASDPSLLLDAWHEDYEFEKHFILKGHIAARSSDEIVRILAKALKKSGTSYAMTGLPAAWLMTRHAGFRLVTCYVSKVPSAKVMAQIGFREEPRGSNVWLVKPNDEGIFNGCSEIKGIQCVSAVQVFLDLKGLPERSNEAAAELRKRLLNWGSDDKKTSKSE